MNKPSSVTFTVGRLLCGPVREALVKAQFKGLDIQYHEGPGWFEREFIVKGADADVRAVHQGLSAWIARHNLDE